MSIERSIPIDGPAGSGKSTVAKLLSSKLDRRYVSTGEMFRALAIAVIRSGIDPYDSDAVTKLAKDSKISLEPTANNGQKVFLNDEDISEIIRTPEVDRIVSPVSTPSGVREIMSFNQREIAKRYDVIMDGRDIGTVVLPDAKCKFFLTADIEERARRRMKDYQAIGQNISFEKIVSDLRKRDEIDSTREIAPLKCSPDAHFIDSTYLSVTEVIELMLKIIQEG